MTTSTWWCLVTVGFHFLFQQFGLSMKLNSFFLLQFSFCYWNEKIHILHESQNDVFIQKLLENPLSYIIMSTPAFSGNSEKHVFPTKNTSFERWKWSMSCDESNRDCVEDALCHDQQWASCKIMTIDGMLQPSRMMFLWLKNVSIESSASL